MRLRRACTAALLAGALLLTACSDGNTGAAEQPSPDGPTVTEAATPTARAEPAGLPTDSPTDEQPSPDVPTVSGTATPTEPAQPAEPAHQPAEPADPPGASAEPADPPARPAKPGSGLPGEVVEIHPFAGGGLGVIGVAADDVLNVRKGPGVAFDVVAELDPLTTGIAATGHNRRLADGSFWSEIEVGGGRGWSATRYLAYPGHTTDITSQLAELPSGPTMEAVGKQVARQQTGEHPPSAKVIIVDGPRAGDLHEVVLDVTGYADDAVLGERLHVFAVRDAGGYTVRNVEATLLCARGLSDGLCI